MNTHPNTPLGKFFFKIGIWHPNMTDVFEEIYNKLHPFEQEAVKKASALIAVVNANIEAVPDFIFDLLAKEFPALTKESITEDLGKLNAILHRTDEMLTQDFDSGLELLQNYLKDFDGNAWITMTKAVVSILTDIFLKGKSPAWAIETVLEYVYQTFVKGKI